MPPRPARGRRGRPASNGAIGAAMAMPPCSATSDATQAIRSMLIARESASKPSAARQVLADLVAVEERDAPGPLVGELVGERAGDRRLARAGQAGEEHDGARPRSAPAARRAEPPRAHGRMPAGTAASSSASDAAVGRAAIAARLDVGAAVPQPDDRPERRPRTGRAPRPRATGRRAGRRPDRARPRPRRRPSPTPPASAPTSRRRPPAGVAARPGPRRPRRRRRRRVADVSEALDVRRASAARRRRTPPRGCRRRRPRRAAPGARPRTGGAAGPSAARRRGRAARGSTAGEPSGPGPSRASGVFSASVSTSAAGPAMAGDRRRPAAQPPSASSRRSRPSSSRTTSRAATPRRRPRPPARARRSCVVGVVLRQAIAPPAWRLGDVRRGRRPGIATGRGSAVMPVAGRCASRRTAEHERGQRGDRRRRPRRGTPSSFRPDASSRTASTRRMIPPGARLETWAPIQRPGDRADQQRRRDRQREAPEQRGGRAAAEPTSGIAWARSVPTSDEALSAGWSISSPTTTIDPAPDRRQPDHEARRPRRGARGDRPDHDRPGGSWDAGSPRRAAGGCATSGAAPAATSPPVEISSAIPSARLRQPSRSAVRRHEVMSQAPAKASRDRAEAQPQRRAAC